MIVFDVLDQSVLITFDRTLTSQCAAALRYNELLKAGLVVPRLKSLAAAPVLLAAQSDFATDTYREANAAKLSVTRVFAAGGDRQNIQLQPKPGTRHHVHIVSNSRPDIHN